MVYLPEEKLLIEADAFTPPPPNTPPPAVANANNVNLVDNIERLKLVGRPDPAAARPGGAGRATCTRRPSGRRRADRGSRR